MSRITTQLYLISRCINSLTCVYSSNKISYSIKAIRDEIEKITTDGDGDQSKGEIGVRREAVESIRCRTANFTVGAEGVVEKLGYLRSQLHVGRIDGRCYGGTLAQALVLSIVIN